MHTEVPCHWLSAYMIHAWMGGCTADYQQGTQLARGCCGGHVVRCPFREARNTNTLCSGVYLHARNGVKGNLDYVHPPVSICQDSNLKSGPNGCTVYALLTSSPTQCVILPSCLQCARLCIRRGSTYCNVPILPKSGCEESFKSEECTSRTVSPPCTQERLPREPPQALVSNQRLVDAFRGTFFGKSSDVPHQGCLFCRFSVQFSCIRCVQEQNKQSLFSSLANSPHAQDWLSEL